MPVPENGLFCVNNGGTYNEGDGSCSGIIGDCYAGPCYDINNPNGFYPPVEQPTTPWYSQIDFGDITEGIANVWGIFRPAPSGTLPQGGETKRSRNYTPWIILGVILLLVIVLYFALKKK